MAKEQRLSKTKHRMSCHRVQNSLQKHLGAVENFDAAMNEVCQEHSPSLAKRDPLHVAYPKILQLAKTNRTPCQRMLSLKPKSKSWVTAPLRCFASVISTASPLEISTILLTNCLSLELSTVNKKTFKEHQNTFKKHKKTPKNKTKPQQT